MHANRHFGISPVGAALLLGAAYVFAMPALAAAQTTTASTTTATTANTATANTAPKAAAPKPTAAKPHAPVRKYKPRPKVQMAPTPARISEIQSALATQGAYKGEPNGKWDDVTAQAMKNFQSAHGLTPTGKLDALSLQKLGLGSEIAGRGAPLPVPQTQTGSGLPAQPQTP